METRTTRRIYRFSVLPIKLSHRLNSEKRQESPEYLLSSRAESGRMSLVQAFRSSPYRALWTCRWQPARAGTNRREFWESGFTSVKRMLMLLTALLVLAAAALIVGWEIAIEAPLSMITGHERAAEHEQPWYPLTLDG